MFFDESDGVQKILFESVAEAVSLIIEIGNGLFYFGFCRSDKANRSHLVRALRRAKTSSAGIASMLPALYSAYRRSASSAHS